MAFLVYGDCLIQVKPVEPDATITQTDDGQHWAEYLVKQISPDTAVVAGFLGPEDAGWVVSH